MLKEACQSLKHGVRRLIEPDNGRMIRWENGVPGVKEGSLSRMAGMER